jgi:chorismate mutase
MKCRGIRGATTADANTEAAILFATTELLQRLLAENQVAWEDIAGIFLTTSPDLDAAYPAKAARQLGMRDVPLMCAQEMNVPGGVPRCVRILVLANTERTQADVVHVYLHGAQVLRPEYARS